MTQRIPTIGLYGRDYTIPPWWECFALLCKHLYEVYSRAQAHLSISTFASSVYTPSIFDTAKYFNVSTEAAILPLTLYVLGGCFHHPAWRYCWLIIHRIGLWAHRISTPIRDIWSQTRIPIHHSHLSSVHAGRRLFSELWFVAGLPLLCRCLWGWLSCNRRRHQFRPLAPNVESRGECSVFAGTLPRASHRSASGRICGNGKRMEMDTVARVDDWPRCTNLRSIPRRDIQEDHPTEARKET
jgi:hypothetical protein